MNFLPAMSWPEVVHELTVCPVTATNAVHELTVCPVTPTEAIHEFPALTASPWPWKLSTNLPPVENLTPASGRSPL